MSKESAHEKYRESRRQQARPFLPFTLRLSEDGATMDVVDGPPPEVWYRGGRVLPGDIVTCDNAQLLVILPQRGVADPRHLNRIDKYMCDTCGEYPDEDGVLRHGRGCELDVEVIPGMAEYKS